MVLPSSVQPKTQSAASQPSQGRVELCDDPKRMVRMRLGVAALVVALVGAFSLGLMKLAQGATCGTAEGGGTCSWTAAQVILAIGIAAFAVIGFAMLVSRARRNGRGEVG
jgi:hypothetical protein